MVCLLSVLLLSWRHTTIASPASSMATAGSAVSLPATAAIACTGAKLPPAAREVIQISPTAPFCRRQATIASPPWLTATDTCVAAPAPP
jgi:hypothetical protein